MQWGAVSTNEELALRIRFIGLAKTPYIFDNPNQLKHGFTAIGVGTGTTHNTGEHEIFPGDPLEWDVVPRPREPGGPLPGGSYGDLGPGSRQTNPRVGTARGRIRFRINPSRFNDMRPSINAALACLRKTAAQGGCSDREFEHLFSDPRHGNFTKPTPAVEHAMALSVTMAVTAISGAAEFVRAGLMTWGGQNNPDASVVNSELTLADRVGCFETTVEKRALFNRLIDMWFLDFSANRESSREYAQRLKDEIPSAFNIARNTIIRNQSLSSRYVQVRTNLANLQELGFARAVNSVTRRRIGTALSYSKKGQGVDVLLGHFLQSY